MLRSPVCFSTAFISRACGMLWLVELGLRISPLCPKPQAKPAVRFSRNGLPKVDLRLLPRGLDAELQHRVTRTSLDFSSSTKIHDVSGFAVLYNASIDASLHLVPNLISVYCGKAHSTGKTLSTSTLNVSVDLVVSNACVSSTTRSYCLRIYGSFSDLGCV